MICIQCGVQVLLFWLLTEKKLSKPPRIAASACLVFIVASFKIKLFPENLYWAIGLVPTVLNASSRVPQIVMNFRQKHTSNLSAFTWGLSGIGNTIRVITTVFSLSDGIQLF